MSAVEFNTRYQYNKHLQNLLQSLPQLIGDLVQIVQQYLVVEVLMGTHLDSLDTTGMWLEAEVVKVNVDSVYIHYIGYATGWDEWIHLKSKNVRLALVHSFSPSDEAAAVLHADLQLFKPTDENKARRITRFVTKGWSEKDIAAAYEKLGWYRKPCEIDNYLKSLR